ncbi:MAG: hypothetical protein AAF721_09440 [Myxococcota bacterium]
MRVEWTLALLGLVTACGDDNTSVDGAYEDSFQDDDIPMGGCGTGETNCTGGGSGEGAPAEVGDPCDGAGQCASTICAADFSDGDPGAMVCQAACIEPMDNTKWCSDSDSCCGAAACSPRGLCLTTEGEADGGSSDESAGSDGGATGSGGGTGTTGAAD